MALTSVLLFGSCAREANAPESDKDILLIDDGDDMRHRSSGRLSLHTYPWARLEANARAGDLFVCHLVREAKIISDPNHCLAKLRNTFVLRSDYWPEIARATDLGWFLLRFGDELNPVLQGKRALWCVRTILIARSAERGEPTFAPERLIDQTACSAARALLMNRHRAPDRNMLRRELRAFLQSETVSEPFHHSGDRIRFVERFRLTSNRVALQTLEQGQQSQGSYA